MLLLFGLFAIAAAAPATYDQRQDGDFNVRADVQNVVFLIAIPQKMPASLLDGFLKRSKQRTSEDALDRADVQVMEAFVEPDTPYQVEIGPGSDRSANADGRAVEVLIAGRRRSDVDPPERDEYKLLGATEQCGPDHERDPVTLTCRARTQQSEPETAETTPEKTPEIISVTA